MNDERIAMASLGFGCMRLPTLGDTSRELVDIAQLEKMVDAFMEAGFCYFDTARTYHGGLGEGALKRALVDRYPRERFVLAAKAPAYLLSSSDDAERMFYISLEDLRVDYVDCYLLHNLGGPRSAVYERFGLWDFVEERRDEGLVRHVGFSFHGTPEELEHLLDARPGIDFVQLQINYVDWDDPIIQSRRCYEVARKRGIPIVAMEPLKGGLLANRAPDRHEPKCKAVDRVSAALRFVAELEGVELVLSGMSTIQQLRDNIAIMKNAAPLDADERRFLACQAERIARMCSVACTSCGYCSSACKAGVMIPQAISALNLEASYGDREKARQAYLWTRDGPASSCTGCGICEKVCPQHLPVRDLMKKAAERFEG